MVREWKPCIPGGRFAPAPRLIHPYHALRRELHQRNGMPLRGVAVTSRKPAHECPADSFFRARIASAQPILRLAVADSTVLTGFNLRSGSVSL